MRIPAIQPYPMPDAATLPPGPAPWRPDPARAALLIHDMQRYFVDFFPAGREPVVPLLATIARLRALAGEVGIPVVYSVQPGRMSTAQRGLLLDVWGPGMTDAPGSHDVVPEIAPAPGDVVITKTRYSAFHRTELAAELARLGRDQLLVCGVFAHLGCLFTAADAFAIGIQPFLVADAVADFSRDLHVTGLQQAARSCAVPVGASRLSALLRRAPARAAGRARPAPPGTRSRAAGRSGAGGS